MGNVESGVQTLYYGLFHARWRRGGLRQGATAPRRQAKERPCEYKLYVAERYASNEYLSETKREILDSIRDLARRIEHP